MNKIKKIIWVIEEKRNGPIKYVCSSLNCILGRDAKK